jgi:UDP-2,3-diacylglucosamine hydrolase
VALIFLSDVHLRLDRPERGRRLARFLSTLGSNDRVVIVGDLCDFWFATRQTTAKAGPCEGLLSLKAFRDRGGLLILLPGNHDTWLGPYYESKIGVGYSEKSFDETIAGLRFFAVHGHECGAQSSWKSWMKGRAFYRAFSAAPGVMANALGSLLDLANSVRRETIDLKHLAVYRRHANSLSQVTDVCIFGHIHLTHDDAVGKPRLIVLGGWHHRSSYIRVDDSGHAALVIVEDAQSS